MTNEWRLCVPRRVSSQLRMEGDRKAVEVNPENAPPGTRLDEQRGAEDEKAALDITRYWGDAGAHLTVGFIETPDRELRARILAHLNAWSERANVSFTEVETDPQVRIARWTAAEAPPGEDGYWSAVGTDVLLMERGAPTMNLEAFTMNTSEAEFRRVVRHEAGHTLGFPHEHMRKELVERLDRERVIAAYMRSQGWSKREVIAQILTPLEESSLLGSAVTDATSIMCYQIPGTLTRDGLPILGGVDINAADHEFAALVYPKAGAKTGAKAGG